MDASDVTRLSRCLPALDSLSLVHVVKDWNTAAAFTQLMPGLTHLAIGGPEVKDSSAQMVAKLTSLDELDWTYSDITPSGLQQLTALTNLDMPQRGGVPPHELACAGAGPPQIERRGD